MKLSIFERLSVAMAVVASIGLLDALYLTYQHYQPQPISCFILEGCDVVTNSPYATFLGIPVALLGAAYYFLMLLLIILFFLSRRIEILKLAILLTPIGFLASFSFLYLQIFVIGAICSWCLISALTSTILFALGILLWTSLRGGEKR
ncbi:hypothetical protein A2797_02810 [candidate division WWE3 bacterium RIFCSPHIGHO2_01_FULL_48_15]|uniref:Vitamin K epoxide reductase domain-containing protein n=1 Tax=candidate division WWE3 bacterium RIFCSPHIGHO2_01_FULL_48_15 TaxID=1802619 RepID=A0A1F4VDS2_UNCKA|nr:MAG: hypothetical protein A2797_02810 [candidate division WWE3 bacterium RIFCSPHIGHO2_01_FULL_48_15]